MGFDREERSPNSLTPYLLRQRVVPEEYDAPDGRAVRHQVHLRDYWRVVVKHRSAAFAVFLAAIAGTAVVSFTMTRRYTATAEIQIQRTDPKIAPVESVEDGKDTDLRYDYYQTQFRVLRSRTIAARVIHALNLDTDEHFRGESKPGLVGGFLKKARTAIEKFFSGGDSVDAVAVTELDVDPALINAYLRLLEIVPVRGSRIVQVSVTTRSAALSAEIANRHVEEYVNGLIEERLGMTLKAKDFLEAELAKSRDRVMAAEEALNTYRKAHKILSVDGGRSDIVSERLADLNTRYTEAQAERFRLEGLYALIAKREYESLPEVLSSELVSKLKQAASVAEARRAQLRKKFKPDYPDMAEAIASEQEIKQRLDAETRKIVSGVESNYLAAKNREQSLKQELDSQRDAALTQKDFAADYSTLFRDVETARDLYNNLLRRLKDVDVAEQIKVSNVTVVDRAATPLRPSRPRPGLYLAVASGVGLILGIGLAFLLQYLDNTIQSTHDVTDRLQLPTLGVIPSFDSPLVAYGGYGNGSGRHASNGLRRRKIQEGESGSTLPSEVIVSRFPRSVIAEAYRTVRTKILMSSADRPCQVILFTSGSSREGKTVTAINQAISLVQNGGRVLLIDADIRKSRIHKVFNAPNGHGLSTYLCGQSSLDSVIHEIDLNGATNGNGNGNGNGGLAGHLAILPAGPHPPNPAELLGSKRMRDTIQLLRQQYDYIVIDTPPVIPVADAILLSTMSDGVVLVVRGQDTPMPVARKARDDLHAAGANILGVVLNDVSLSGPDYYDYRAQYGYWDDSEHVQVTIDS